MRLIDLLRLTTGAVRAQRLRAVLTALGIGIGVTAVVLLTSIGAGVHRFVLNEFTQSGTNIVSIAPGRTRTFGGSIGAFGNVRPLTVEDAQALQRVARVRAVNAFVQGNAEVEAVGRKRRTTIYAVSPGFTEVFRFTTAQGEFLPLDDARSPRALAVLGSRMSAELFDSATALGQVVRVSASATEWWV
jgi:putative ABC transport system permease protein